MKLKVICGRTWLLLPILLNNGRYMAGWSRVWVVCYTHNLIEQSFIVTLNRGAVPIFQ